MGLLIKTFRSFVSQAIADLRLLKATPQLNFSARPNHEYWRFRPQSATTPLNSYQKFRVEQICLEVKKSQSVIDLGSGTGAQCVSLASLGYKVTASDFSVESLQALRQLNLTAISLNLEKDEDVKKIGAYDVVIACEVFVHTTSPERIIFEAQKSGVSCLIFSVPNTGYYVYRLRLLFGRFPCQWRSHPGEHCRFWTISDMKWWLEQLNINQTSKMKYYEGWPILNKIMPSVFAKGIFVVVRLSNN